MASTQAEKAQKIDAMMDQASKALVSADYFGAERLAAAALRRAHQEQDYERMARILLPLQEARRLKRQLALDADSVTIVSSEIPSGRAITAGCYLVMPPRVGVDGRQLRDAADEKKTPAIVIVREPTARDGRWPLVTVGPVTIRTKVAPPVPAPPKVAPVKKSKKPVKGKVAAPEPEVVAPLTPPPPAAPEMPIPTPEWFVHALEQLGDEAISQVAATLPAASRVDALMDRLEAHPSHEKLHQRLQDACREAVLEPPRKRRSSLDAFLNDDF